MQLLEYKDIPAGEIPVFSAGEGVSLKALAGNAEVNGVAVEGRLQVDDTLPIYLDITLAAGAQATVTVPDTHNTLVYTYDGAVTLHHEGAQPEQTAPAQRLSRLTGSGVVSVSNATDDVSRVLILAGKPLGEPIAQHGPFVMNTPEEIAQAVADYQAGTLTD